MASRKQKVVIVSDVHLGYPHSDRASFETFLDTLSQSNNVDTLIILGDFVDMWRRDASGLFLEFNSILEKIITLKEKLDIYVVAGNHDYHLLKLTSAENPFKNNYYFKFQENIPILEIEGIKYRFMHGHEFDLSQWPPIMELLCKNFSDEIGQIRSNLWNVIQLMGKDIFRFLWYLLTKHKGSYQDYVANLNTPAYARKNFEPSDVEKRANDYLKNETSVQRLVFGHTHRPFVSSSKNLANSGSWITDENTFNTYIEIDGTNVRLMKFGQGDITNQHTTSF